MPKLYQWDELGCEITEAPDYEDRNPAEWAQWQIAGHLQNGVVIFATDRHFGCEVWAETPEEAHEKFMAYSYYKGWQEDNEGV